MMIKNLNFAIMKNALDDLQSGIEIHLSFQNSLEFRKKTLIVLTRYLSSYT